MTTTARAALTVDNAKLSYGSVQALQGVSLEARAGEILGLLGPNGAGKTTLLQCIAGRKRLDSGSITCHLQGKLSDVIGVVPQEIALYRDLTVRQNAMAFGRLLGIPVRRLRERVREALHWSQLEEKSQALVGTLSGGMQRRLNIACSVLHEPSILLLDEPTVGVDPQSRERIYEMLDNLLEQETAILLTTHHLEEAQDRCDRIAVIDEGRIIQTGSFDELLARTIGTSQHVHVRFSAPQRHVPAPLRLAADGSAICEINDVSVELPRLLTRIRACQLPLESLSLRGPTLQQMFLHLTGKELRE